MVDSQFPMFTPLLCNWKGREWTEDPGLSIKMEINIHARWIEKDYRTWGGKDRNMKAYLAYYMLLYVYVCI